jgi:hypothetical protein
MEGGILGPPAWADPEPCETAIMLRNAQWKADSRLVGVVERLDIAELNRESLTHTAVTASNASESIGCRFTFFSIRFIIVVRRTRS